MNIEQARFNMIEQQIRTWDVLDQSVLSLLAVVKREDFVPGEHKAMAFVDTEVPLRSGQSMLAPKVEARFLQELDVHKHERVLEIGTGSGYMAALLGHKGQRVVTLEILPELASFARGNLERAGLMNVTVRQADGSRGLPEEGPFDAIMLSGSVSAVPPSLLAQLKPGGRLAAVVGEQPIMRGMLFTRGISDDFSSTELFDTVAPRLAGFEEPSRFRF
jgi:protein-L-isoaspartate(D-aspartate) O-methyltransferase